MDKHNLEPLRPENINPAILIQEVSKNLENIESIFVVAFDASGQPTLYTCGDIKDLVYSGFVLSALAQDLAREYDEY